MFNDLTFKVFKGTLSTFIDDLDVDLRFSKGGGAGGNRLL